MFVLTFASAHAQINVSFNVTEPSCFGLPDGSITAIPSGGAPPYAYVWNTGATVQTLNNIPAGAYSVTVTSSNGFTGSGTRVIAQPDLVVVDFITEECSLPLSVTAVGSGGTPPYTYHWSTGATTPTITNLAPGNYCITLTDASQCGTVDCITLDFIPVNVAVNVTPVSCPGALNGAVTATAASGVPPFSFEWSTGATGPTITGLGAGSYTVTLTDGNGCTSVATGTVTQPPPLSVNLNPANPTCAGFNNGSIAATAGGGTPPYTYQWSTGQSGPFIINLAPGIYTVTVTDANGCPISGSTTLTQLSNLTVGALGTAETCPDFNDGFLTASANNGVPPYAYAWSNGATTQVVTNVTPGNYSVTVTDAAGCSGTANAAVQSAPDFQIQVQGQHISICGGANGSATVNILSGAGPFTYNWNTGANTQTVSNLGPGTYFVTVTNPNQCVATGSVTILAPPNVGVVVVGTPLLCPGETDGTAIAMPVGGTSPFTYLWNTGATTASISGLSPGTYTVTVTDAFQCTAIGSATINQAPGVNVTITGNPVACGEGATGTAMAVVNSGTPPFTYQWDNGSTNATITGLQQGNYTVVVTDANGCQGTADFTLAVIDDLDISVDRTNVLCFGENTGAATASGSGGDAPYTFQWSNGATGPTVSNLPAGPISVTLTDANGCSVSAMVILSQPPLLQASIAPGAPLCPGSASGTLTASATGGVGPYTFLWNTGATSAAIDNLPAGSYSVTVTDANGCTSTAQSTIAAFPGGSVNAGADQTICPQAAAGLSAAVVNGTGPFSFQWSTGATSQSINVTPDATTTYGVTVTDANGCAGADQVTVTVAPGLNLTIQSSTIACGNIDSGSATGIPSGGTPPYTFLWNTGDTSAGIDNLGGGTYSLTVTDANGCTAVTGISLIQPPALIVNISTQQNTCAGENDGSLIANVTGGTGPFEFLWSNNAATGSVSGLAAGSYSVTVTDINGCTASASGQIASFPVPACSIEVISEVINGNDGALTAGATGGTPPYSFAWSSGQSTAAITGLEGGMYAVTLSDANGCTSVCSVMLTPLSGLGDFVWEDIDKDGQQDAGEPGFPGITVKLKDGNGDVIAMTTTNAGGFYQFIGLDAGSYSVMFVIPDGYNYTPINAVMNDSLDSDADLASMEMTQVVTLAPGEYNPTLDAGIYKAPEEQELDDPCHCLNNATNEFNGQFGEQITIISYPGETWQVIEGTGMWDINSPEPPGIPIPFTIGTFFTETSPGVYTLPFKLIDEIPYSAKLSNGTDVLTIGNNCIYPTINLSELPPSELCVYDPPFVPSSDPSVDGTVTYFVNGMQVDIIDPSVLGEGLFEFVAQLTPIDPNQCIARVVSTFSIVNNCFAKLGDYVWEDIDRDGIQDFMEEGVPNVTVRLKDAMGTVIDSTLTEANGYYLFDSLPPGTYSVWFVLPYGYRFTVRNAGNDDTVDNDADMSTMGMTHMTTLEVDGMDLTLDGGIYLMPTADIGDPCNCLNNSTTDLDGQFTEEFTVHSYPGETWRLIGNEGMYQLNSPEPPAAPIPIPLNTVIPEGDPGEYVLTFRLVDEIMYTAVVTNGFDTLSIHNLCKYPTVNLSEIPAEICVAEGPITFTVNPDQPGETTYYLNGEEVTEINPVELEVGTVEFTTVFTPDDPEECETHITTIITVVDDCFAKLGDFVWLDLDHDGKQDAGEPGIPNVKVTVNGVGTNYMDMTLTDNTGMYMFMVPPGTYKVTFTNPGGLTPTLPNAGSNDAIDSDMDPVTLMAPPVTLGPDEMNLTIDAGFYGPCENITQPGQIGYNQVICGPGNDPDPFVSLAPASGGSGDIEYLWMMSTSGGNFNDGSWAPIPNTNSPTYDPGPIFVTTYYVRCARRDECTAFLESNILVVEVDDQAIANIGGPEYICQGDTHTYTAVGAGPNAVIQWNFGNGAIPQTASGHSADVTYSSFGTFHITLMVTENGCTSTDVLTVVVTNSPTACPNVMGIDVNVTDEENRMILVSWEILPDGLPVAFEVERSADGEHFGKIADVNTPSGVSGQYRLYSYLDQAPKMGRNYYRVRIRDSFGNTAYSGIGSAVLYGASRLTALYPNPVTDQLTVELFETFGEPVGIQLITVSGIVLQNFEAPADAERMEIDFSPYPAGAYLLRLRFGETQVKTLKVVKLD